MKSSVYLKSFGCSLNFADGEFMAGCLKEAGYKIAHNIDQASVVIYNTCAVKAPTENKMIDLLKKVHQRKKLIVAGCLPLINLERVMREVDFDGIVGPAPGRDIVKIVNEVERGGKISSLKNNSKPPLSLPRVSLSRVVSAVPIAYGCLGECSYCCVRFARGKLRSYSISEVVEEVKRALADGAKEIWLTAQDSAAYGRDIGANLASLVRSVTEIDGDFLLRIGMMNPNSVLRIVGELIEAYKSEKVFKFLHIPVQSGDDQVLRLMNRRYSVDDFRRIVRLFRESIPSVTIATDFICGFPGESDQAFRSSINLLEKTKPDIVNISKFFPRPKTPAKNMEQLPSSVVKARSKDMMVVARRVALERNKKWLGWTGEILIDEVGKYNSWIGRNFAYKPVVIESSEKLLGKKVNVVVSEAFPTHLKAYLLN